MSIKKAFTKGELLLQKAFKSIFIAALVITVLVLFFDKNINFLDKFMKNDVYIAYISVGIVLFAVILSQMNRRIHRIQNYLKSMDKPSYTSEADMVSMLGIRVSGSNTQDFLPVSYFPEEVNLKTYRDADASLASYKTFDFDYINKTNPLLEKELFGRLEKVLNGYGMTRAKENPQAIISMDFFIGKKEQYTPPTTVTNTELKYVWNAGMIGWTPAGFSSAVPVVTSTTTEGYTTTTYYTNIRLNFLDHAKLVSGEKLETPPLIWIGEADSEGFNSDIRGIAPFMFGELIKRFSDPSINSPKCQARRFRYGGIGLGFDPSDWRIIRYIEPFSVAAEQGIKPKDVLIKINGKDVGNWPAVNYGASSTGHYSSKDPYFQNILSNRGDSEVELQVRVAETGKTKVFRIRPKSEDCYVGVSNN
jgi:hypothetical protein